MDSLPHTMARSGRLIKRIGLHYMPRNDSHYNKVREIPGVGAKKR
jgi:hypothetical protein